MLLDSPAFSRINSLCSETTPAFVSGAKNVYFCDCSCKKSKQSVSTTTVTGVSIDLMRGVTSVAKPSNLKKRKINNRSVTNDINQNYNYPTLKINRERERERKMFAYLSLRLMISAFVNLAFLNIIVDFTSIRL